MSVRSILVSLLIVTAGVINIVPAFTQQSTNAAQDPLSLRLQRSEIANLLMEAQRRGINIDAYLTTLGQIETDSRKQESEKTITQLNALTQTVREKVEANRLLKSQTSAAGEVSIGPVHDGGPVDAQLSREQLDAYKTDLARRIKRGWFPPHTPSGTIVIDLKIDADGSLLNHKLKVSGGNSLADEAAMKSMLNASPYRKLPAGTRQLSTGVRLTNDDKGPVVQLAD